MSAHVDILEQRDSLKRPVAFSVAAHVLFFGAVAAYTIIGVHNRVTWGDPHALGGGSVGVNAVSQIPLPARSGAENLLANDTESRVPMAPKPQKKAVQAPQPDADTPAGPPSARAPEATHQIPAVPAARGQDQSALYQLRSSSQFEYVRRDDGHGRSRRGSRQRVR